MQTKKLIVFVGLLLVMVEIKAQIALPATGGNGSGSGGTVSYSVGQIIYTATSGSSGTNTQGVQQPYEISVVTGLETGKNILLQYKVYPNPVADVLILKIDGDLSASFTASLFDINGKLLISKGVESNETSFDLQNLAPATYFLLIAETKRNGSPRDIKTFKIIKN
jgi:hypothetical protein